MASQGEQVGAHGDGCGHGVRAAALDDAERRGIIGVHAHEGLWLDGVEQQYIEEVGAMNIFFIIDDELITPMLSGSILPGITRDSVIALGKSWDIKVTERKISIDEVVAAHDSGKLQEIFGSGTAAVISPVGELKYGDKVLTIGDGSVGPVASKLFNSIQDIQYGNAKDLFEWIEPV